MRLKKWSEAERFHRAALEAEPTHVGAHISFGTMLARNVSVVSWCRVWWVDANFTFSFRFCNIQSSRSSEAEQYFKRAIRLAPLDSSVHHHYGNFSSHSTALKHLHIMEKKSEFLIWWIINFPFPHHPLTAEFLTSISRHEEACESRVRAAELSPNDYQLVTAAATSLRMLDRKHESEKWYRQVSTRLTQVQSQRPNTNSQFAGGKFTTERCPRAHQSRRDSPSARSDTTGDGEL